MTPKAAKTPKAPKPQKILVVDDDASIREILATQLSRLNYETVTAGDGEEGVKAFKKERPDLVVLDVMMPRMDGIAACQQMRESERKGRRTPIIFLTARDSHHDKLTSAISGGDDFCSKPIAFQELRERVEKALAKKK
jgi:DNA-binding response OmpR family regulator